MLQGSVNGASSKLGGCFNGVLSGFKRSSMDVSGMFQEFFKEVLRVFQGSLSGVIRDL